MPAEPPGKPKNTGVDILPLLQGIFLTQESNRGLLHCRQILYQLSCEGSPISRSLYFFSSLPLAPTLRNRQYYHPHLATEETGGFFEDLFIYFIFDCPGCWFRRGLSPIAARGTPVSAARRRLLFWSTGSRCSRSVLMVLGLSCPEACGICRDLALNCVLPKVVAFPKLIFCQKFSPSSHVQRIC